MEKCQHVDLLSKDGFHHFQVMGRIWNSWHVLESTPWKQVWGNGAICSFPGHPELWTPLLYAWWPQWGSTSDSLSWMKNPQMQQLRYLTMGNALAMSVFFSYMCLFYPFFGGHLERSRTLLLPWDPRTDGLASCRWSRACRLAPQWWMKCLWVTMSWARNHRSWACVVIAVQMLCFAWYLKFDPYLNGGQCWRRPSESSLF